MAGYIGSKAVSLSTTAADVTGDAEIGGDLTVDTNTLYVDSTDNQVGIGTSSPDTPLEVQLGSSGNALKLSSSADGATVYLAFEQQESGTQYVRGRMRAASNGVDGGLIFETGSSGSMSEAMRIDSSGQVGIGTNSPQKNLHLSGGSSQYVMFENRDNTMSAGEVAGGLLFMNGDDSTPSGDRVATSIKSVLEDGFGRMALTFSAGHTNGKTAYGAAADYTDATIERMRIDSSGNLLVGGATAYSKLQVNTDHTPSVPNTTSGGWDNTDSDGVAVYYTGPNDDAWGGKAIGGVYSKWKTAGTENWCGFDFIDDRGSSTGGHRGSLYVRTRTSGAGDRAVWKFSHSGSLFPLTDNAFDLGSSSLRLDDIYATNSTIQTSDENEKQQIASLTDAEMTAAKAISKLFKTFKWNSAVEAKGDAARTHTGVIAQQVEQAMTDAGLDADDYAFFVRAVHYTDTVEGNDLVFDYDDDERTETATKHEKLAIRYPELLSFIGAATEQRLASIETRLDALEANE